MRLSWNMGNECMNGNIIERSFWLYHMITNSFGNGCDDSTLSVEMAYKYVCDVLVKVE